MKYFKGEIAGNKLTNFNKIDYGIEKLQDRNKFLEDLLGDAKFFTTYFGEYYDVSPSQNGFLAEETAVCRSLEIMGTYILGAKDIDSERKIEYKFWKSEKDFKKSKESENVNASTSNGNGDVEIIDMFVDKKNDKNQKVVKPVSVNKNDIKNIKEIRDLEGAIEYLKSDKGMRDMKKKIEGLLDVVKVEDDLVRLQQILRNIEQYIGRYVGELRESQLLIKKALTVPIEFKNVLKDEGAEGKLDEVDFFDKDVVKVLIELISREDLTTDIGLTVHAFNQVLSNVKLAKKEKVVVELFKEGYTRKEVMEELNVSRSNFNNTLNRIADKFIEQYESEIDVIYKNRKNKGLTGLVL